jgi:uncharacterized protein DUF5990
MGWGQTAPMRIVVVGTDLPGRSWCDGDGLPLDNVHVAIQVGREPQGLVRGDAPGARWELEVRTVVDDDGQLDFRGPPVHGPRGDRFLYVTWGEVQGDGTFAMFRRAKLMLTRVEDELIRSAAVDEAFDLVATVRLTDDRGGPRCARVDPPAITWRVIRREPPPAER